MWQFCQKSGKFILNSNVLVGLASVILQTTHDATLPCKNAILHSNIWCIKSPTFVFAVQEQLPFQCAAFSIIYFCFSDALTKKKITFITLEEFIISTVKFSGENSSLFLM